MSISARRLLCGQNSQRHEAGEIPVEAPKKFELVDQSENRQTDRSDDSAECAGASGSGDQVKLPNNRCPAASSTFALCALLFVLCGSVHAQQKDKVFRIGFLDPSTASGSAVVVDVFRQELSKLGWIEGKNISIEYRFAEQKNDRMRELAAELVRLSVDLIVTTGMGRRSQRRKRPLSFRS